MATLEDTLKNCLFNDHEGSNIKGLYEICYRDQIFNGNLLAKSAYIGEYTKELFIPMVALNRELNKDTIKAVAENTNDIIICPYNIKGKANSECTPNAIIRRMTRKGLLLCVDKTSKRKYYSGDGVLLEENGLMLAVAGYTLTDLQHIYECLRNNGCLKYSIPTIKFNNSIFYSTFPVEKMLKSKVLPSLVRGSINTGNYGKTAVVTEVRIVIEDLLRHIIVTDRKEPDFAM